MMEGSMSERWLMLVTHAWSRLEHSFRIAPQLPAGLKWRSNPRIQLWNDAQGWCDDQPKTWTVYEPWTPETGKRCVVREAEWDRDQDMSVNRNSSTFLTPTINVRDAEVPVEPFYQLLSQLSQCDIAVITLHEGGECTDDVGSEGFKYYSNDQPSAQISMQWSDDYPADWAPVVTAIENLKQFLTTCLGNSESST
jgi:hypothetical protein